MIAWREERERVVEERGGVQRCEWRRGEVRRERRWTEETERVMRRGPHDHFKI